MSFYSKICPSLRNTPGCTVGYSSSAVCLEQVPAVVMATLNVPHTLVERTELMLPYYLLCSNHFTWKMTVWLTHGYDMYLSKLWKTIAKYRRAEKLLRHNLISTLFVMLPMQQYMAAYHLQLHWVCLSNGTSAVFSMCLPTFSYSTS